jgi:dihydrolipoamide dehydrogenase
MPTKALLASSEAAWRVRHAVDELGVPTCQTPVDTNRVLARVARIVRTLQQAMREKVDDLDAVDFVPGRGRLLDATTVEVVDGDTVRRITGRCVVIATGSTPVVPGFLPSDDPRVMTSDDATRRERLGRRAMVLGAGALGCEFATAWSELGVDVTLVEQADRLLPMLDPDASQWAARSLSRRGVDVCTATTLTDLDARDDALVARLTGRRDDAVEVDQLLVAVSRAGNLEGIGLEDVGVRVAEGIIEVDDRCRTNVEGVFAVGDVAESRRHSHLAVRMGTVAGETIMGLDDRDDRSVVVSGVYTHPEIACVGSCGPGSPSGEDGETITLTREHADSGTALAKGDRDGLLKLHLSPDGCIRGALWVGPRAIDMIHEIALAMREGIDLCRIYRTIHAHPSYQEGLHALAEEWFRRTRCQASGREQSLCSQATVAES